jgi:hypothetical protein
MAVSYNVEICWSCSAASFTHFLVSSACIEVHEISIYKVSTGVYIFLSYVDQDRDTNTRSAVNPIPR